MYLIRCYCRGVVNGFGTGGGGASRSEPPSSPELRYVLGVGSGDAPVVDALSKSLAQLAINETVARMNVVISFFMGWTFQN